MKIRLSTKSMLNVSLVNCDETFTFIVNNQEYKSTRITALLLSSRIQKNYSCDATCNKMNINTNNKGNFQNILDLTKFHSIRIPENEISFVIEVIQQLSNEFIHILGDKEKLTIDNIIKKIKIHEKFPSLYEKKIKKEIDFISIHFSEILETQKEEIKNLSIEIIEEILQNPKILRRNDDQILSMINELYLKDRSYTNLYEYVDFTKISLENMKNFSDIFDMNDLTNGIWMKLKQRMNQDFNSKHDEKTFNVPLNNGSGRNETIKKDMTIKEILSLIDQQRKKAESEDEEESSSSYDCIW